MTNTIHWELGADGVVILTLDDPNQSVNTMNADYIASMRQTVDRLMAEKESIRGVILTSAKDTFFAGGDIKDMFAAGSEDAPGLYASIAEIKAQLRALETLGRPVVAALNGAALGGGLEIALACHRRIVVDRASAVVGFPEVTLGILPGGGGVVRTVRMLGVIEAVSRVLSNGRRFRPAEAQEIGLVDEVVEHPSELISAAKEWIAVHPDAVQPWDAAGHRVPGGTPADPALAGVLPGVVATARAQVKGANYPAPRAILAAAVEGLQVDFDTAQDIETRYLISLVTGQVSKNMMKAFFFDMGTIRAGGSRPADVPRSRVERVGVLGAGLMGAGIAFACARAGIDVVLKDVSLDAAERGRAHAADLVAKEVSRRRMSQEEADALVARITPVEAASDLAGVDLVVEAVFESVDLKHQVFQEVEAVVGPDTVLGSNTSSLPITRLAEGVAQPANFIGLHFFSPVDKMALLEIIAGAQTGDETLAKAFDFAQQIRKTPIVVNDHRGFFTSRVIGTFINEGIAMVGEGVAAASVEQAGLQAGYPVGPLQLADEVNLSLMSKVQKETKAGLESDHGGRAYVHHPGYDIVDAMVDRGRTGKAAGAGFYEYEDGRRTGLWMGLADAHPVSKRIPMEDMKERMLFAEAIETVKCFDEGVLRSVEDANVGSILGIGFPGWTGGVAQYVEGYPGGVLGFVRRAQELAVEYGERFEPPSSLVARAEAEA